MFGKEHSELGHENMEKANEDWEVHNKLKEYKRISHTKHSSAALMALIDDILGSVWQHLMNDQWKNTLPFRHYSFKQSSVVVKSSGCPSWGQPQHRVLHRLAALLDTYYNMTVHLHGQETTIRARKKVCVCVHVCVGVCMRTWKLSYIICTAHIHHKGTFHMISQVLPHTRPTCL